MRFLPRIARRVAVGGPTGALRAWPGRPWRPRKMPRGLLTRESRWPAPRPGPHGRNRALSVRTARVYFRDPAVTVWGAG